MHIALAKNQLPNYIRFLAMTPATRVILVSFGSWHMALVTHVNLISFSVWLMALSRRVVLMCTINSIQFILWIYSMTSSPFLFFLQYVRFDGFTGNRKLHNALVTFCEVSLRIKSNCWSLHAQSALNNIIVTNWFTLLVCKKVKLYIAAARQIGNRFWFDYLP